jgi:hypothetical protein
MSHKGMHDAGGGVGWVNGERNREGGREREREGEGIEEDRGRERGRERENIYYRTRNHLLENPFHGSSQGNSNATVRNAWGLC